jgi:hypothetical protein
MSRFILVATMVAVTIAGCNRFPDNGLQIVADLPPDSSCIVGADQDTRLFRGLYDLAYRTRGGQPVDYVVALLLQSYIISNRLEFQGEQGNLQVDNLEITILLPDGSAPPFPEGVPNPYSVDTSAVLATATGSTPSQEVAAATGIPAAYQDLLRGYPSIILEIRAGGTTFGGFSQRSAPFRWPVDLCEGCLLDCQSDEVEDSCLPGQDIWPYCPFDPGSGGTGGAGSP